MTESLRKDGYEQCQLDSIDRTPVAGLSVLCFTKSSWFRQDNAAHLYFPLIRCIQEPFV